MKTVVALILVIGLPMLGQRPADADEYHVFLTASCLPQIGFFSITTHGVNNPREGTIEQSKDILTAQKLEQEPYNCALSDGVTVTVKGVCRAQMDIPCGSGHGPSGQRVGIFVNGELLDFYTSLPVADDRNWLTLGQGDYLPWHSVEIIGYREGQGTRLYVLHCQMRDMDRLDAGRSLRKIDNECESFYKVLSGR